MEKFTLQEVLEELEKEKVVCPCKHGGKRKRKHGEESVIYNQKSAWWGLSYWKDLLLPHNLDVMHIEKNICEKYSLDIVESGGQDKGHNERYARFA